MIQSMESFDILMDELNEYFIEDEISKRCGIGGINTSNLGNIGAPTSREVTFFGVNGTVTCWIEINKSCKRDGYSARISSIRIKLKRG